MALRIAVAVAGGYCLAAAIVSLGAYALKLSGMARSEAVVLSAMSGFVVYLLILLWGFCETSLRRLLWALVVLPAALQGIVYVTAKALAGGG
ncbi:MAG: hypothetical protein WC247_01790 [Porticoccaceae bacterium]